MNSTTTVRRWCDTEVDVSAAPIVLERDWRTSPIGGYYENASDQPSSCLDTPLPHHHCPKTTLPKSSYLGTPLSHCHQCLITPLPHSLRGWIRLCPIVILYPTVNVPGYAFAPSSSLSGNNSATQSSYLGTPLSHRHHCLITPLPHRHRTWVRLCHSNRTWVRLCPTAITV